LISDKDRAGSRSKIADQQSGRVLPENERRGEFLNSEHR
jgi:hypothetical protein